MSNPGPPILDLAALADALWPLLEGRVVASFPGQKGTGLPLPNQVIGLALVAVSAGEIDLSWGAVSGQPATYTIFRGGTPIATGLVVASYADSSVTANTGYTYTVAAVNGNGQGLASAPVTGTTPPARATGLTATAVSSSQINLNWTTTPGATSYTVFRGASVVGTPSVTAFSDTGLAANTSYTYTVAASGPGGQGAASTVASATTLPAQVVGLTASAVSSSQINLAWTAQAGIANYTVRRGGVSVGTPSAASFSDTGLTASTLYSYTVAANGTAGQGAQSAAASATTQAAASGGQIVMHPGHIVMSGTDDVRTSPHTSAAFMIGRMQQIAANDVNNQVTAFLVPMYWAQLESPGGGVYDGSWDASGNSGFSFIQQIINAAKAMTPPRGIFINVNCTGNGLSVQISGNSGSGFPGWFMPSYFSSTTYGNGTTTPNANGFNGVEWVPAYNQSLPANQQANGTPSVAFHRNAVGVRTVALVRAYYNHFGPDTATGGLLGWDPYCEISGNSALTFNNGEFMSTLQNTVIPNSSSGMRGAAPKLFIYMKPTFLVGNTANANYQPLLNLMKASFLAIGEEDTFNRVGQYGGAGSWMIQAYQGISTFNGGTNQNWPNHVALNDMACVCNADNAEMGKNSTTPVPPAQTGSGYIYDTNGVNDNTGHPFRGIMQGVNLVNACYTVWHPESFHSPCNVNRGPANTSTGAQPNPAGGPNPGSTAVRPDLIDVITNNPTYASLGLKPMPIPNKTYPTGWPT